MGDYDQNAFLIGRTRTFSLRIIKLYSHLKKLNDESRVLGKQLLRSGTSVGAQYRESLQSRSDAEFLSKIQSSLQELEETIYWFELLIGAKLVDKSLLEDLIGEAGQIKAMMIATCRTMKAKNS